MSTLTPVAFDIETTGFEATAQVTVLGLVFPKAVRVFVNIGEYAVDAETLEASQSAQCDDHVVLTTHDSEAALLTAFSTTVSEKIGPRDYFLTAYNGELWKSGFDLPFLRTRFLAHEIQWPFEDVPYADLLPIFKARFNTTPSNGDDHQTTLGGVYERLIGGELTARDPFDDSAKAIEAFESGEFDRLVQYNITDILRTQALANVAQRYCSKSDFKLKSLSPTVGY